MFVDWLTNLAHSARSSWRALAADVASHMLRQMYSPPAEAAHATHELKLLQLLIRYAYAFFKLGLKVFLLQMYERQGVGRTTESACHGCNAVDRLIVDESA